VSRSKQSITSVTPANNGEVDPLAFPFGALAPTESTPPPAEPTNTPAESTPPPTSADNGEGDADFGGIDAVESLRIKQPPPADSEDDYDCFDVKSMLASPITGEDLTDKVEVARLPVRKPRSGVDYFRVHPDEAYRREFLLLEVRRKGAFAADYYFLDPKIHEQVIGRKGVAVFSVVLTASFEGELYLWPVRRASGPARSQVEQDLIDAIRRSFTDWIQVVWAPERFRWDIFRYKGKPPAEPVWPKDPFKKILKLSFEDHYLSDPNHELLREDKEKVS
jgi:hypothetical protein